MALLLSGRTETYEIQSLGEFAENIEYGVPHLEKMRQPLRMLKNCDVLLVQRNANNENATYLLLRRAH
ncbi:MAG: hypothetical protein A2X94_07165 [Bdellovibrionales bacterium GWB1_55_8]|nr:MAG: hypothetical protein A2X94_07165 [Bdellovibrionales bacterium GWB1_55_8]